MTDCIFCEIAAHRARSWMIHEDEWVCAFLDINPVNRYHTLVIPRRHFVNIFDLPEYEAVEMMKTVRRLARAYHERLGMEHAQIITCAGRYGQQDVFHAHIHIVPRRQGDGQNVRWQTHPEWAAEFDAQLSVTQQAVSDYFSTGKE